MRIKPYKHGEVAESSYKYIKDLKFYFPRFVFEDFSQPVYSDILFINVTEDLTERVKIFFFREKNIVDMISENNYVKIYSRSELPPSPEQKIIFTQQTEIVAGPYRGEECEVKKISKDIVYAKLVRRGDVLDLLLKPEWIGLFSSPSFIFF